MFILFMASMAVTLFFCSFFFCYTVCCYYLVVLYFIAPCTVFYLFCVCLFRTPLKNQVIRLKGFLNLCQIVSSKCGFICVWVWSPYTHTPAGLTSQCMTTIITTHKHPYLTTELFFVCLALFLLRFALERTLMWAEAHQLTTAGSHAASGRGM